MVEPTFIGNWNLFKGSITDGKVSVVNSTCQIEDGGDGRLKLTMGPDRNWQAYLRVSNDSGYLEATGGSVNWFDPKNFIFLILSTDGSMFHGAVKQGEKDPPLPWWGVRQ